MPRNARYNNNIPIERNIRKLIIFRILFFKELLNKFIGSGIGKDQVRLE